MIDIFEAKEKLFQKKLADKDPLYGESLGQIAAFEGSVTKQKLDSYMGIPEEDRQNIKLMLSAAEKGIMYEYLVHKRYKRQVEREELGIDIPAILDELGIADETDLGVFSEMSMEELMED